MTDLCRSAAESLHAVGWAYEPPLSPDGGVPSALRAAPGAAIRWVSSFSLLSSADETTWFWSGEDYSSGPERAFAWNELEQLSIQAAITNDEAAAVSRFWSRHVPILLSVRDGYEYLAVRDDGAVVHGAEPEFEDASVVWSRFEDLLEYIVESPPRRDHVVDRVLFGTAVGH